MDFQNRVGSKFGGGGPASAAELAADRQARQHRLGLEAFDIDKDPYVVRNNLGQFVCKLCVTVHRTLPSYIAHTQGKKHQEGLRKRAALQSTAVETGPAPLHAAEAAVRHTIRIGRPGYRVVKQRDPETRQRSLLFELNYPDIEDDTQPRHRFMGAFEQRKERPDKAWQYLLFAADPYETVGFKIPSDPIDRREGRLFTDWNPTTKLFRMQLFFRDVPATEGGVGTAAASAAVAAGSAASSSSAAW